MQMSFWKTVWAVFVGLFLYKVADNIVMVIITSVMLG